MNIPRIADVPNTRTVGVTRYIHGATDELVRAGHRVDLVYSDGVPAVAFDVGGIRDWLEDGVNGRLAPGNPPTPAGLSDAVVSCLSDAVWYRRARSAARATADRFASADPMSVLEPLLHSVARSG